MDADDDTVGHNGGKVQTFGCNGQRYQDWYLDSTDVRGLFRIRTVVNGRCLDADNTGGLTVRRLQVWDCLGPGQLNQYWWLVAEPNGRTRFVSDWNGQCMQADDVWANSEDLQLYDCLDTPQELWWPRDPTPDPPIYWP
jgi:hypothetical protein